MESLTLKENFGRLFLPSSIIHIITDTYAIIKWKKEKNPFLSKEGRGLERIWFFSLKFLILVGEYGKI